MIHITQCVDYTPLNGRDALRLFNVLLRTRNSSVFGMSVFCIIKEEKYRKVGTLCKMKIKIGCIQNVVNPFTCAIFQTGVFGALHNFPCTNLLLSSNSE